MCWRLLRGWRHPLLHQAGSSGNPEIEDFFTEEYALNHLIHNYGKPYIAFWTASSWVAAWASARVRRCARGDWAHQDGHAETAIGLFPDVGGGYFSHAVPGHVGEWLALTGDTHRCR